MAKIAFHNITKQYPGASKPAVDAVSFALPEGSTCMLVGTSGSGKTTLLRMVNRLIESAQFKRLMGQRITVGSLGGSQSAYQKHKQQRNASVHRKGLCRKEMVYASLFQIVTCGNITLVLEPVVPARSRLVLVEKQWMVGDEDPSREMEKQRRGKTNGIHAVQDSAVPFNGAAKILHAAVTLDGRHCQPAGKSHERHSQREQQGLERREWSHPPQRGTQCHRSRYPANKAFPCFVG